MPDEVTIADLIGKVLIGVDVVRPDDDIKELVFHCMTTERYRMWHDQDCCESVFLHEVIGDMADLHGLVIDAREESRSADGDPNISESGTWTFYIIQTQKGAVTLRWLGESNGYYSEDVSFDRI